MNDHQEQTLFPTDEVRTDHVSHGESNGTAVVPPVVDVSPQPQGDGLPAETNDWHAEAGRKGARRVHELIQRGRLYEQEHGLKSGRQRLRQLAELGRLYEQEHGLRPDRPKKRADRLRRGQRDELIGTLLRCLLHIAKPSLRADLQRLIATLDQEKQGDAAEVR